MNSRTRNALPRSAVPQGAARLGGAGWSIVAALLLLPVGAAPAYAQPATAAADMTLAGSLANGTEYQLYRPAAWNGVLVLNPDLPFGPRGNVALKALHDRGYATGNQARTVTTWNVRDGSSDLAQLKSLFVDRFGPPKRTIVTGGSLGGLVTRDAGETYPEIFDGAVPTCGGGAGLIAMYNNRFDVAFVIKTLLAPGNADLELAGVKDDARNSAAMKTVVQAALTSPQGRARLALAAAIGQIQGWPTGAAQPPADDDYDAQLKAIADTEASISNLRSEVEKAAGGVFDWNVGVDYRAMFAMAGPRSVALARELYRRAGLSLDADLDALNTAPRQRADAEAVAWARNNGTATGRLKIPTLVLFTAVDPRAPRSEYRAYQRTVDSAGAGALLRQVGVDRSGHCNFVASEQIAAIEAMDERLQTGRWPAVDVGSMNARASAINAASGGALGAPLFAEFPDTPEYSRWFTGLQPLPPGALAPAVAH